MRGTDVFIDRLISWAAGRADVRGIGLAGSWARGTATDESDLDLILIVDDVVRLLADDAWPTVFGEVATAGTEDWGQVQSRRVHYADGLEVEFGLTTTRWSSLPLDPGTRQVVADGFEVLYDTDGSLHRCAEAVRGADTS